MTAQGGWRGKHYCWLCLFPGSFTEACSQSVHARGKQYMCVEKVKAGELLTPQNKTKASTYQNIFICFVVSDLHPLCVHSKHREDSERSIFIRLKEGGYRLRENILFHLYVSTSPCGDARLNSPYEITTDCKKPTSLPLVNKQCQATLAKASCV